MKFKKPLSCIFIIFLGIDFYFCEYVSKLKSKDIFFYSSSFWSREQRQCRNAIKPALFFPLSCTLCPLDQTYLSGPICKFPLPQRQQNENTFLPIKHFRMDFDNKSVFYCLVTRALSQQLHKPLLRLSQSKSSHQTETIPQVHFLYSEKNSGIIVLAVK